MYGQDNFMVHKPETFEMTTLPVELGEVKLPGAEWNKIARMLEERDRLLKAKSVLVYHHYGLREASVCTYKTMSPDEHVQELARLSAEIESMKQEWVKKEEAIREECYQTMKERLKEETEVSGRKFNHYKQDIATLESRINAWKNRGFFSSCF